MEKTKDYSIFKIHDSNRELNQNNLDKLEKSLSTRNLLEFRPILVDENMKIIDGQHRFEAAKKLGLEIYYTVMKKAPPETILLLNTTQKKWGFGDFLKYHVAEQNQNYIEFNEFTIEHELSWRCASELFCAGRNETWNNKFKEGKFIFSDEMKEHAINILEKTQNVIDFIRRSTLRRPMFLDTGKFKEAVIIFLSRKGIDIDQLMKNIELKLELIRPCVNKDSYLDIFVAIYNFRNRKPIDGKYQEDAEEEAQES